MTSRARLITGNWKMNHTRASMVAFLRGYGEWGTSEAGRTALERLEQPVRLFLPSIHLATAQEWRQMLPSGLSAKFEFGAQNVHGSESGAFTGETSSAMLRDLGVQWSLVGHSERRSLFGESQSQLQARLTGALSQGLNIVYCIGETLAEREAGQLKAVLLSQLQGLTQLDPPSRALLTLAYEPVWAIGTGVTATPAQAVQAHETIRQILSEIGLAEWGQAVSILYGGSVSASNVSQLLSQNSIDGALVGGASWKVESWIQLIQNAAQGTASQSA